MTRPISQRHSVPRIFSLTLISYPTLSVLAGAFAGRASSKTDVHLARACRAVSARYGHDADIWPER
jgi:hypothetical protein